MPTRQVRAIYKQRLDEVTKLEKHIVQARARDLAETEHATKEARLDVLETPVKLPPGRCEVCPSASCWCCPAVGAEPHLLHWPLLSEHWEKVADMTVNQYKPLRCVWSLQKSGAPLGQHLTLQARNWHGCDTGS